MLLCTLLLAEGGGSPGSGAWCSVLHPRVLYGGWTSGADLSCPCVTPDMEKVLQQLQVFPRPWGRPLSSG